VAVLARALEGCDQADRKVIEEAMETITTERRRAYSDLADLLLLGRDAA
jgi:phosphoribosyl-ATP pyrophosphohydrolase